MNWFLLALAIASGPATADDLLAEARRRAVVGDFEGTRMMAEEALEEPGIHHVEAQYLRAMGLEFSGRPAQAIEIYDQLLHELDGDPRALDVRFRRAEALGRAGRPADALAELDLLGPGPWTPTDEVKLALLRGLWEIELDDRDAETRGLTRVKTTLETASELDAPAHQAMARARLAELAAAQAKTIPFRGPKRKKSRRLEERATLVTISSDQIAPMITLQAPQWTLPTFLVAGHALEEFGQALLEESRVRGLNKRQRPIYEDERRKKVEAVWVKASRYYDRGIQYAEILGWQGPEAEALRRALSNVIERVDDLATQPSAASAGGASHKGG